MFIVVNALHELTPSGQHKCHTKRCLEFEKNAASHTTFARQLTCRPETL